MPQFEVSLNNAFLRRLAESGRTHICLVCDIVSQATRIRPETYWHRPIVARNMNARLGDVIGFLKIAPEHWQDDIIDQDVILLCPGSHLP